MAIHVSVQYNGRFLPDIIMLTLCYYHQGIQLNVMKFCLGSLSMFPPTRFDNFSLCVGNAKKVYMRSDQYLIPSVRNNF